MATPTPSGRSEVRSPGERKAWVRGALLVGGLALAVYLPGFWWGAPAATAPDRVNAWGVDDETPLGPLAEVHNIIEPKADRNLGYPLFYSFLVSAAYTPYLVYLWQTDQVSAIQSEYPYGLEDPVGVLRHLTMIAHLVTVLLAVGMAVALFDLGWTLGGRRTAFLTAALGGLTFPVVYYARTGNVDMPMLSLTVATVAVYARAVVLGITTRRIVWLGIFAGLAMATKEASVGAFLGIPFVLWWSWRRAESDGQPASLWRLALVGSIAAFLALGMASGLFVDPSRYIAHLGYLTGRLDELAEGEVLKLTYGYGLQDSIAFGLAILRLLTANMTLPGLLLAAAGLLWFAFRDVRRAAVLLPALTYLVFIFLVLRAAQLRYIMPAAVLLSVGAAALAVEAMSSPRRWFKWGVPLIAFVVMGIQGLRAIDLSFEMIRDSRFAAAEWFEANADSTTTIEYFGASQKLPPLPRGAQAVRATEYYGMYVVARTDAERIEEILAGWDRRRPDYVVTIPDHSSPPGVPHSHTLPPELYRSLLNGSAGYRLVAQFETPRLLGWLPRPPLDYPSVNPPIRVFERTESSDRVVSDF